MKFKVNGLNDWDYEIREHGIEYCVELINGSRSFWLYPDGLFTVRQPNRKGFKRIQDCAPEVYSCVRFGLIADSRMVTLNSDRSRIGCLTNREKTIGRRDFKQVNFLDGQTQWIPSNYVEKLE